MNSYKQDIKIFNENIKRYLVSSLTTFLSTFILVASSIILSADMNIELLNRTFWVSLLLTAFRAAIKAVFEAIIKSTGDKK